MQVLLINAQCYQLKTCLDRSLLGLVFVFQVFSPVKALTAIPECKATHAELNV